MALSFHNSLTKKIEEFKPIRPGEVSMYCCGPTVYNYVHIGNLRAYVFGDLLRRYLKFRGFTVKHVMNITDIDDKTIRDSRKEGRSLKEFTEFYTEAFLKDIKTLNIEVPEVMPRATAEVDGMVEMIQKLLSQGHAYKTDRGDIYFKISTFSSYGQLVNIDLAKLKKNAGGRLADEYDKEDASDFALWKAWDENDGDVFWETAIGKGRPGWHIECSVMAARHLGQPLDIHCGGIDLMFPHHTNEIAQSECASEKKFVNYWMHNAHLIVDGRKMSKSLKNFFTLRDLLDKGLDPMAIRYEFLKTHYRQTLDFRLDNFTQNLQILRKFEDFLGRLEGVSGDKSWGDVDASIEQAREGFIAAMDDDLNISGGFTAIFDFMSTVNRSFDCLGKNDAQKIRALMMGFNGALGVIREPSRVADPEIDSLIAEREAARKRRDFKRSDEIRDELLKRGITIKDGPQGATWHRV